SPELLDLLQASLAEDDQQHWREPPPVRIVGGIEFANPHRLLGQTVVSIVRESLRESEIMIVDYGSAMVACDEAEERDVEAGVLMALLRASQEAAAMITSVHGLQGSEAYYPVYAEFGFTEVPEGLHKAMKQAINGGIRGCKSVSAKTVGFRFP